MFLNILVIVYKVRYSFYTDSHQLTYCERGFPPALIKYKKKKSKQSKSWKSHQNKDYFNQNRAIKCVVLDIRNAFYYWLLLNFILNNLTDLSCFPETWLQQQD